MLIADVHNDLLQRAIAGDEIWKRLPDGHSDFIRMKEAGIVAQILSVWVPVKYELEKKSYQQALNLIHAFKYAVSKSEIAVQVYNPTNLENALQNNKLSLMMGMEGGHPIENDLEKLEEFFRLGMRYMSPTWNNSVSWATSAKDETNINFSGKKGLNDFGISVIKKMNALGMMIDVSHVGEQTFWDIAKHSNKPFIASHSSVYNLCPHARNLKDEQLKEIAKSGGVAFINFFSGFLDKDYFTKRSPIVNQHQDQLEKIRLENSSSFEAGFIAEDHFLGKILSDARPPLSLLIDHIDYAVKLIGVNHVGIGSDFDGIETAPTGLDSVLDLKTIAFELEKRGYSQSEIEKIMFNNFIRVFNENQS